MSSQSSRFVRITSKDKTATSHSNSDFEVDLKEKVLTQHVKTIMVHQALVPNVFYNINSSNNEIKFTENGQAATSAILPVGQYVIADLMAQLKIAMDAMFVGTTVAVTQQALTKKLIFTYTGQTVILDPTSTIAPVIGLTSTLGSLAAQTMDYITNLRGYDEVYIHSRTISPGNMIDGNFGLVSVLASVSLNDAAFGQVAYYQSSAEEENMITYSRPVDLSVINIVLRDSEGNRLDIGTSDMTVIFRISY